MHLNDEFAPNDKISPIFAHLCTANNLQELVKKLNTLSAITESLQSVHLLIYHADKKNHILFYPEENKVNSLQLGRLEIDPKPNGVLLVKKYQTYDKKTFTDKFNDYSHLKNFSNAHSIYHVPLSAFNRYIGKIEVVNIAPLSASGISDLEQISTVVSLVLAKIFDGNLNHHYGFQDELLGYAKPLSVEENRADVDAALEGNSLHNHVLVEVTEAVIGQVNFEGLATVLFLHLQEHFGIEFISIMSFSSDSESLSCHEVNQGKEGKAQYIESQKPKAKTMEEHVIQSKKTLQLSRSDYPLLKHKFLHVDDHYMSHKLSSECVFPLLFRQQVLGVIKYGHRAEKYFSEERLDLLKQIAARISVAINYFQNSSKFMMKSTPKDLMSVDKTEQSKAMFGGIISQSKAMREVFQRVLMVADCDSTVLILGETGTGKEMIANMIHNASNRSHKKMVKMNCSAVPSGLFESDLFGHVKGAFTGAVNQQVGRFEEAHKSSFFLDEIGDMPLQLQPKVLRALQEGEIERVGKHTIIPVDVRMIAATHCDLLSMVKDNSFRRDLYYRLNVFPIRIPPLRERREDIPLLAKHFTQLFSKKMNRDIQSISPETLRILYSLPWPGNVRELKNVIERAVIMNKGQVLHLPMSELKEYFPDIDPSPLCVQDGTKKEAGCFPDTVDLYGENTIPKNVSAVKSVKSMEREQIIKVLKETNGIVAGPKGAAHRLGLKRTTLLSRMQRLGITSNDLI
ncbi:NifA subfamily transcriptional regulator [Psychromonas sp. CNPT3]|uniref:sigma 54-interacting transcriptional regulator n=1 Tax=Psychromonas sp. CNPT3 TaxID=314282 RepID=UPI0002C0E431|nr:sigma 54-interacting transcriptional regulator [Psychromonas sp. CNPT3]AGH82379.1 NifA subfamily transcriptional regulator [Psychromonas sp. CNPT3]